MLSKDIIMDLYKRKQYVDIANIFAKEYEELVFNFAKEKGIYIDEDTIVEELIAQIICEFPNLEDICDKIMDILYNEEIHIIKNIDDMVSNYNMIKKALS